MGTVILSALSYWEDYFRPDGRPARPGYSTGWIAARLHGIPAERGPVAYWDNGDRPAGIATDVYASHLWAFAGMCRRNDFGRRVAVSVILVGNRTALGTFDARWHARIRLAALRDQMARYSTWQGFDQQVREALWA